MWINHVTFSKFVKLIPMFVGMQLATFQRLAYYDTTNVVRSACSTEADAQLDSFTGALHVNHSSVLPMSYFFIEVYIFCCFAATRGHCASPI